MVELFKELFLNPSGIFLPPILSFIWTSTLLIAAAIGLYRFSIGKLPAFYFSIITIVSLSYASTDYLVTFFWSEFLSTIPSQLMHFWSTIGVEILTVMTMLGVSIYWNRSVDSFHKVLNPFMLKVSALLMLNAGFCLVIILVLLKFLKGIEFLMLYALGVNAADICLCVIVFITALKSHSGNTEAQINQLKIKDVLR